MNDDSVDLGSEVRVLKDEVSDLKIRIVELENIIKNICVVADDNSIYEPDSDFIGGPEFGRTNT